MDPLCISLVHQYLESTNSVLAGQFKTKYQPKNFDVKVDEVLYKWDEEQLTRSVVYQHLKTVSTPLALEFRNACPFSLECVPDGLMKLIKDSQQTQPREGNAKLEEDEEKLIKSIVFQHLRTVAPSLALEFKRTHCATQCCFSESDPELQVELFKKSLTESLAKAVVSEHKADLVSQEELKVNKRIGRVMKKDTYTAEEVLRIKKAIANNENMGALAKEMGRTYKSVSLKIWTMRRVEGFLRGKYTVEENERVRQAVKNNEDYKKVAKELRRDPRTVFTKMMMMKSNPNWDQGQKKRAFSLEEDLLILDTVIPNLKFQKLSGPGCFSLSDAIQLSKELQRNYRSVKLHWESTLQRWLLQHYNGTSGLRVEKMLTCLVAQRYTDHMGIDWSDIVNQHKEFAGHTSPSIRKIFHTCLRFTKKQKRTDTVSLQEVAECTAVYQAKKESPAKTVRREKIIEYFKKRVEEMGLNVVV